MVNTAEKKFTATMSFLMYDKGSVIEAQNRFEELKKEKVIKSISSFEDNVWYTTDEYQNVGLHFSFNQMLYKRFYEKIFQMSFDAFIDAVKVFMTSLFGQRALSGIHHVLLELRHLIETDPEALNNRSAAMPFKSIETWQHYIIGLISDDCDVDLAISFSEALENYSYIAASSHQRTLATYDTYFLFDELVQKYWAEMISADEREFYYPLYLWWMITSVIPQRPHEFLLIPRDCLSKKDGNYYMTFRRNRNKGFGKGKTYHYTIDEAYQTDIYPIPEKIGKLVEQYLDLTKDYTGTEIDTLFRVAPHYKKWGFNDKSNSRFFTLANFNTVLRYFYKEIIEERYGYKIVDSSISKGHLKEKEIGILHPGDTRHIALINLMQSGGTPTMAMMFAGHSTEDMADHYYSNLTTFIQCRTFREYRRFIASKDSYDISSLTDGMMQHHSPNNALALSGGKCSSEKFYHHDYADCLCSVGPNGEIGYCPNCIHYSNDAGLSAESIYKSNLKADCIALADAVNLVRQDMGHMEDIAEIMNRLHGTSHSYQEFLMHKRRKENANGTTEAN